MSNSDEESQGAPASAGKDRRSMTGDTGSDLCPKTGTETGLPCIKTWKAAYIFVACTFCLWVALLICLTEMSA